MANAFNTIDRTSMLKGAAAKTPAMFPWLRCLYTGSAYLFCQEAILLSKTGVHQGCPLGPAAFAAGLHPAIEGLSSFCLTWGIFYLDDGLLVAPVERLVSAFPALCTALNNIGLRVNLMKICL